MKFFLKIAPPLLVAIVISYFLIDRPLCAYIYHHNWPQHLEPLKILVAGWPVTITSLAPFLFFAAFLLKPGAARNSMILLSLSIMLTFVFKNDMKWVFSRYWPLTWVNNNISWITNHAYGFAWFQGEFFQASESTGSFPSGHTAIAFAALLPIGLYYRQMLTWCIILASLEGFLMIAFDFHFLSDVLAGALLGITCTLAVYTLIGKVGKGSSPSPVDS